jgi:alpha-tubulin suppressor-like RCC1 family protein
VIAAGGDYTCAIVNGAVLCWGDNAEGQLGNGMPTQFSGTPSLATGLSSGATAITAGYEHACAVVNSGVQCWGYNGFGQLGDGTTTDSTTPVTVAGLSSGVTAIGAGVDFTCALLVGGAEKCWGNDHFGQLGNSRFLTADTPQTVVAGDEIFRNGFE